MCCWKESKSREGLAGRKGGVRGTCVVAVPIRTLPCMLYVNTVSPSNSYSWQGGPCVLYASSVKPIDHASRERRYSTRCPSRSIGDGRSFRRTFVEMVPHRVRKYPWENSCAQRVSSSTCRSRTNFTKLPTRSTVL